ncbi:hypothetical protein ACTXT7_014737 [Hymenolepis weldensis]
MELHLLNSGEADPPSNLPPLLRVMRKLQKGGLAPKTRNNAPSLDLLHRCHKMKEDIGNV